MGFRSLHSFMTLAFILFIGTVAASPAPGNPVSYTAVQTPSASDQQPTPPSQTSASGTTGAAGKPATATQPSSGQNQTVKKATKHKKPSPANCNAASTQTSASKSTSPSQATDAPKQAPSPCPPSKVIVRQGSTSDSSIELVGGAAGSQASDERKTAIEMLGIAETNLKKMDDSQLNSSQQDMIKQVHQFMDQSKAATSAGDLDQARTLAWKAQLLSEELLKTQK